MTTGKTTLSRDLTILEAMAAGMKEYLTGKILFQPMGQAGMPSLTLGGYLMREHRLQALGDQLLDPTEQSRLSDAHEKFRQAVIDRGPQFEQKANQELAARLRQWDEFLKDLARSERPSIAQYQTAVEPRAMVAALRQAIDRDSRYHLDPAISAQISTLDENLRRRWRAGDFVWPDEWQPAYPVDTYWWLYGKPA